MLQTVEPSTTKVTVWRAGNRNKIHIRKNGFVDHNARMAFQRGQCHALAAAIHAITGWPIFGLVDHTNTPSSPGHIVVRTPKGGYLDIDGTGALARWRKRHGEIEIYPISLHQIKSGLEGFLKPHTKAAIPFAKALIVRHGGAKYAQT